MTPVYSIYSLPQPVKNPFLLVLKVYGALRASLANSWISVYIVCPALALFYVHCRLSGLLIERESGREGSRYTLYAKAGRKARKICLLLVAYQVISSVILELNVKLFYPVF